MLVVVVLTAVVPLPTVVVGAVAVALDELPIRLMAHDESRTYTSNPWLAAISLDADFSTSNEYAQDKTEKHYR